MEENNVILSQEEWSAIAALIRLTREWRKEEIKLWERYLREDSETDSPNLLRIQHFRDSTVKMDAMVEQTLKRIDGV